MNAAAMMTSLRENWPHVLAVVSYFLLTLVGSLHVVLYKRNTRSAVGWIGMIWFAPLIGVTLYGLLGINRVQRRAARHGARRDGPAQRVGHRKSHQSAADHQP